MAGKWKWLAAGAVAVAAWVFSVTSDYFDRDSIPHIAMRDELKLVGSAIYEYHSKTGNWPEKLDDLQSTSLPLKSPTWRQSASPMRILWRRDWRPEPKDNAGLVLIYYEGGLFSKLGRMWVCWGDLRTEYALESDLRSILEKQK